jgi:hypothetical protein
MSRRVRYPVKGAEQAPPVTTLRIRARVRVNEEDLAVVRALSEHFSSLEARDVAARCALGKYQDKREWARRKREVTTQSSSRWAGRVTKHANNVYATAKRNQKRHLADTERAIAVISKKLDLPVHSGVERKKLLSEEAALAKAEGRKPRHLTFGYRSETEHYNKRRRLQHLVARADRLLMDSHAGRVHVTLGGKKLMKNRLHLKEAGLSQDEWRTRWLAARGGFGANGEADKMWGNETIRLSPEGTLEVDLPKALSHLTNVTARGTTRYRFSCPVFFSYRREEWLAQVQANRAVAYDFCTDERGRVYLDASFTPAEARSVPTLEELREDPGLLVLAVDHNAGFLTPQVVDRSGNPVGRLEDVPLVVDGLSASTRDGHLREAVTRLLELAESHHCRALVIENLGFSDMRATGRERYGSNTWFRKTVCAIPTAKFCDRLVAMASRRGIAVIGVPAAYSSIWGAAHWQKPLSSSHHKVSRHTAAAVVLGRRALGHSARRHSQASPGVTTLLQRKEAAVEGTEPRSIAAGVESYHVGGTGKSSTRRNTTAPHRVARHKGTNPARGRARPEVATHNHGVLPAKTVRAGPQGEDSVSLSV